MQYQGDLDINTDVSKDGGDYHRTEDIDSAIRILLGTDSDYWGNILEDNIPGGLEDFEGLAINGEFLRNYEAQLERCLQPLIDLGLASSVSAVANNPYADRVIYKIAIVRTDKSEYIYTNEEN